MDETRWRRLGRWLVPLRRGRPPRQGRALAALALAAALLSGLAFAHRTPAPRLLARCVVLPGPHALVGLALDPALGRAYVADDGGAVWMLDVEGRLLGVTDVTPEEAAGIPTGPMAVDAARHRVYVATRTGGLAVLDGRTGAPALPWPLPRPSEETRGLALDGAADRVLVAQSARHGLAALDAERHQLVATAMTDGVPVALAVDEAARRVYVADQLDLTSRLVVLDADTYATLATVALGGPAAALAVDPTTHRVYAADRLDGTLVVVDGPRATILATLPIGRAPGALALNPTTGQLIVADADTGVVAVVDTRRVVVVATVPVSGHPVGVAVDPRTGRVYVANNADHTVSLLDDRREPARSPRSSAHQGWVRTCRPRSP